MSQKKITFDNLEIGIVESDDKVVYTFNGDIDENFRQQDVPRFEKSEIIFELGDVLNFNSCGIREWIFLVRDIGSCGTLIFRNCSVTMIDQINMVPDSLGVGIIESFYAPYYCDSHGEINQVIRLDEYLNDIEQKKAPDFKCSQCGEALEFDALEESYFLFADTGFKSTG